MKSFSFHVDSYQLKKNLNNNDLHLVCFHGWMGDGSDFFPLLKKFSTDYPIHLYQLNRSTLPKNFSFEQFILALHLDLQTRFFNRKLLLIGYSMGGRLILSLRHTYPKNYPHLIVISAHTGLKNEKEKAQRLISDQALLKGIINERDWKNFLFHWYTKPPFSLSRRSPLFHLQIERKVRLYSQLPQLKSLLISLSLAYQEDTAENIDNVVFISGKNDLKYFYLYKQLKNKNHFSLSNCSHSVLLQRPQFLNKIVKKIIRKIEWTNKQTTGVDK